MLSPETANLGGLHPFVSRKPLDILLFKQQIFNFMRPVNTCGVAIYHQWDYYWGAYMRALYFCASLEARQVLPVSQLYRQFVQSGSPKNSEVRHLDLSVYTRLR